MYSCGVGGHVIRIGVLHSGKQFILDAFLGLAGVKNISKRKGALLKDVRHYWHMRGSQYTAETGVKMAECILGTSSPTLDLLEQVHYITIISDYHTPTHPTSPQSPARPYPLPQSPPSPHDYYQPPPSPHPQPHPPSPFYPLHTPSPSHPRPPSP